MDEFVFYCAPCQQTFAGKLTSFSSCPRCPKCNRPTQSTGLTKEVWIQMPQDQRDAKLNDLAQERAAAERQEAQRNQKIQQTKAYAHSVGLSDRVFLKGKDDGMYAGIGKKIKGWAKWMFIFEAVVCVIGSIFLMAIAEDGLFASLGLIFLIIGPVLAWVSSWLLYGFGELIDKTAENERNTQDILRILLDNHQQNEK